MEPMLAAGMPDSRSTVSVITIGVITVNVFVSELHWLIPQLVTLVSNQYVPLSGAPVGRTKLAVSADKSIFARWM